jgi:broad specificity phosphatase PhoE
MPMVHLLRHGHVHNPDGILYGRLPEFRLSSAGLQMARVTAAYLKENGHDIARVVASPLLRAQQTAQPVGEAFGVAIETDGRLIEAGNLFEGLRVHPIVRLLLHPQRLWWVRNPCRPSWGEPYVDQRERMIAAILDAARVQPERETVLVSHQLPIWVARLSVEGKRLPHDPRKRQCALASLTSFSVEGGKIVGVGYSSPASGVETST